MKNNNIKLKILIIFAGIFLGFFCFARISHAVEQICPTGSNPDPNVLFCEDFENWNINQWGVGSNGDKLSVNDFVRSDKKIHGNYGAWSGQLLFDGDWGTWGYQVELNAYTEQSEMYIRWYTYISPSYIFGNLEDKLFLLNDWERTIGPYVFASRPGGGEHGNFGTGKPGACVYQDCDWGEGPPCDGSEWVNRGQNTGNDITLQPGHTYLFEWYIKLNTPGQRNGIMKLWVDDVTNGNPQTQTLRMYWTNVRYLRSQDSGKKYGRLRLTVYSQRKYSSEPADRYMSWDDIVVSKAPIGSISGSAPPGDVTPPSIPTNLTATPVSSSQINLSWTASTDNVGVSGYQIYRCQGSGCNPTKQIATSVNNSYSDTGLTASTTYVYRVAAYDAAGNTSELSATATATTLPPPDTTPPAAPRNLRVE